MRLKDTNLISFYNFDVVILLINLLNMQEQATVNHWKSFLHFMEKKFCRIG